MRHSGGCSRRRPAAMCACTTALERESTLRLHEERPLLQSRDRQQPPRREWATSRSGRQDGLAPVRVSAVLPGGRCVATSDRTAARHARAVKAHMVSRKAARQPAAKAAPTIAPALVPATQWIAIPAADSSSNTPMCAIAAAPPPLRAMPILGPEAFSCERRSIPSRIALLPRVCGPTDAMDRGAHEGNAQPDRRS